MLPLSYQSMIYFFVFNSNPTYQSNIWAFHRVFGTFSKTVLFRYQSLNISYPHSSYPWAWQVPCLPLPICHKVVYLHLSMDLLVLSMAHCSSWMKVRRSSWLSVDYGGWTKLAWIRLMLWEWLLLLGALSLWGENNLCKVRLILV